VTDPGHIEVPESEPTTSPALTSEIRWLLLDPVVWRPTLEKYASAVKLAVGLVNENGRLIDKCINPRPLWSLLNKHKPVELGTCPFWLAPRMGCTCVADALGKSGLVISRDRTGLVHFTVPLILGEHKLGALIAGQVFTQYPEQLALHHVARDANVSPDVVWRMARLEVPTPKTTLVVYAELLATLGNTFLQAQFNAITERNRLTEMTRLRDLLEERTNALVEADHRKDNFIAMLSHELRNPLGAISSAAQLLSRTRSDHLQNKEAQAIIGRQTRNLSRLVEELLDVSRITSGRIVLKPEAVDLKELVLRGIDSLKASIEMRGQTLSTTMAAEAVNVEGDPLRLEQVVTNLLGNAIKYTPLGGRIGISVQRSPNEAVLTVRDNGIGISPENLSHIFDRFAQARTGTGHAEGGLGIGLSLVRNLVTMHGGSVVASSAGEGQGSEFVVTLPLLTRSFIEVPGAGKGLDAPIPGMPLKGHVLIIEDNLDNSMMMRALMEMMGHKVETASDGLEGLNQALANPPEVALIDIGLPNLDGYQIAQRIRAAPGGDKIFLIACSGYGRAEDRRRSKEAGFDAHVLKPADPQELSDLLARATAAAGDVSNK
jgi:signal transduction histidine kinase/CheY-like chemotaxis protein